MTARTWTIAPLVLGTGERDLSQILLPARPGTRATIHILAWLLRSGSEKVLVDTGLNAIDTPDLKKQFERTPDQTLEAQLRRFDTAPHEIRLVVQTHLHVDHYNGNCLLPNARFVVQRRELDYARDPLPAHRPAYDIDLSHVDFDLVDGDAEITDGIGVMLTAGHSPGSQAVLVDTKQGVFALAGDTISHYVCMEVPKGESFVPSPLYVDLREYYLSLDRLRDLGATILPGHDERVLKKAIYP